MRKRLVKGSRRDMYKETGNYMIDERKEEKYGNPRRLPDSVDRDGKGGGAFFCRLAMFYASSINKALP